MDTAQPSRTIVVEGPPAEPQHAQGSSGATGNVICDTSLTLCQVAQIAQYGYIPQQEPVVLPPNQGFNTFREVTGYVPYNFANLAQTMNDNNNASMNSITFYLYYPIIILTIFIIWLAVWWGGIRWEIGYFLTILILVILLTANILFRQQAGGQINNNNQVLYQELVQTQQAQQESLSLLPQGVAAISSLWSPLTPSTPGTGNTGPSGNTGFTGPSGCTGMSSSSVPWSSMSNVPQYSSPPSNNSSCRGCAPSLNQIGSGRRR